MRKQSGVVPYAIREGKLQILLIRTTEGNNWSVPKGGLEPDLRKRENALKEAYEEAGIQGKVKKRLGKFQYVKGSTGSKQEVVMFSMKVNKVLATYPESEIRERKWFNVDKALDKVDKNIRPYIAMVKASLELEV